MAQSADPGPRPWLRPAFSLGVPDVTWGRRAPAGGCGVAGAYLNALTLGLSSGTAWALCRQARLQAEADLVPAPGWRSWPLVPGPGLPPLRTLVALPRELTDEVRNPHELRPSRPRF